MLAQPDSRLFVAAVGSYVGLSLFQRILQLFRVSMQRAALDDRAKRKRIKRDAKLHPELEKSLGVAVDHETAEKLLRASATELRRMMARKEVSCEQVVLFFCQRAQSIGSWRNGGEKALNCVAEENYDAALERAREIDRTATPEQWADEAGLPLLGVPVSVKDQLNQKGFDSTMGAAARCFYWGDDGAPEDGLAIKLLQEAGAIVFVRTNTQQALMLPESANNVWGVSRNPFDLERTPGGSSGGEGGLIGARCSPLGIGTDIGGSVRIPCAFCGLFGFKPTSGRITKSGVAVCRKNDLSGQTVVPGVMGPMAHSVDDLAAVLRAWLRPSMWERDPSVPRAYFDESVYGGKAADTMGATVDGKRRLRVAYFLTDGWFQPCATATRAVKEAAEALRSAGHEVVQRNLPEDIDGWMAAKLYIGVLAADGNMKSFVDGLEGERLHPMYNTLKRISDTPNALRPIIRTLLRLVGEHRKRHLFRMARDGGISAREFWELVAAVEAFKQRYMRFIHGEGFDILLLPGPALPALPHGQSKELNQANSYNFLLNLLGWPAGTCPITHVSTDEQSYPLDDLPLNQRDSIARNASAVMAGSAGLPVGVQLAAPPFADELVLYAMRELEVACKFEARSPRLPGFQSHL
eukprot:TRINITY_DN72707_c0_g1_i1.p1 TRINITY_DN72707_c0_g1~~TRINITY_DN72707_c0_g1_i1.p1  ORF type:complete len:636 (+),score=76.29 TRINITY_DN72707_c0_g1_i1:51-1958(+)